MSGYDTILATTDFSDPALTAVKEAARLAGKLGGKLLLAYVVEDQLPPMILAASSQSLEEILEDHRLHAGASLEELVERHLPGVEVETTVLLGTPHEAIAELAEKRDAGMIVMGTQGHGFASRVLFGSTTQRVIQHAPCPVLVVHYD